MKKITRRIKLHRLYWATCLLFSVTQDSAVATDPKVDMNLMRVYRDVPTEHPSCENPLNLAVSEEYFVPIANDLSGSPAYNRLTSIVAEGKWGELKQKAQEFLSEFTNSPLREPVTFMQVLASFEMAKEIGNAQFTEAEKEFAESKILYPKSEFVPIILAHLGARFLTAGQFSKSLSTYESARHDYPFHELKCVFQAGVAESNFQTRQTKAARANFNQVLQKCQSQRLRLAAEIRMSQIDEKDNRQATQSVYQRAYDASPRLINKFFPDVLYALAEQKFKKRDLVSSKFLFNEYLKTRESMECKAYAAKRLADITLVGRDEKKKVIGSYLEVKENYPASDPGRYSHIRGLLLSLKEVSRPEVDRRLVIIDDEIDELGNKGLREVAYLDKALALLDIGEHGAMTSLVKVKENSKIDLTRGSVAEFIRDRVMNILVGELEAPTASAEKNERLFLQFTQNQLDLYEGVMATWLSHQRTESKAKQIVKKRVADLALSALDRDFPEAALKLLERAKALGLLTPNDRKIRAQVAEKFLSRLLESPQRKQLALWFLGQKDKVIPFLEPASQLIWVSAAVESEDDEAVENMLGTLKANRSPASVSVLNPVLRDYYRYNEGKALSVLKRWSEADESLARLELENFKPRALELRLQIALEQKKYAKGFDLGIQLLSKKKDEEKLLLLETLRQMAFDGKLWEKGEALLRAASELNISEPKLGGFYYFAGRSAFETNKCRVAINHFETALLKLPRAGEGSEARYRLGKCLSQVGKVAQAKRVWTELAGLGDPFWSKLAKNELNLTSEQ